MKIGRLELREWSFILNICVCIFLSMSALAADHAPSGYLVPDPNFIPDGLHQVQRLYPAYSSDSYVLEFRGSDNQAVLSISEYPGSADDHILDGHNVPHGYEKIGNVEQLGAQGVLFKTSEAGISGYDLFLDDNGRRFRMQVQDGSKFHFTSDVVMQMVNHLARQQ